MSSESISVPKPKSETKPIPISSLNYLTDTEYEKLNWGPPFQNLVRIRTPTDGSCFFHAICNAFVIPYVEGKINEQPLNRRKFIKKLRRDLSLKLKNVYQELSRGELENISKTLPRYSLENMMKELDSDAPVDNVYNEYVSNEFEKDIYILDGIKQNVYITGQDDDLLYKNRPSIVLLYLPGHYELAGLLENNKIKVLFEPDHPLIVSIKQKMFPK